jgi:hypothetical protein
MAMHNFTHSLMCAADRPLAQISLGHPFYEKIAVHLSQGYAVIYIVEHNITQVVRDLSKMGLSVEDYIETSALTIVDADSFYSPSQTRLDHKILLPQWQKIASSVSKNGKFKGIFIMCMPHLAFFESKENQQKLLEYEEQVTKSHDRTFQVLCCYTKELIDRLSLSNLIGVLVSHQNIVTDNNYNSNNANYETTILSSRIIELVEGGLTKALGEETTMLVFKTFRLIYKINRSDIISKSELFEEKLKKMFGEEVAGKILGIIADRIRDEVML